MADGHLNKCKACTKKDTVQNRSDKIEYYRDYDRKRANLPHRVDARFAYRKTDAGKEAHRRGNEAYFERDPTRRNASYIVNRAIRDGKMTKPTECSACQGTTRIQGHHDDYNYPLVVRWLCESCHKDWHRNNTPIYVT